LHATLRLAATLAKAGCQRFVGIGTCFEYDIAYGYLSEETPTSPNTLYGASKLAAQLILGQLASESDMEIAWLRLFYLYGPFEKQQRLVSSVICSLLKNQTVNTTAGEQIRDYLYIEDVATAIWAVAQSKLCGPVNIGSGQPVSIKEIVSQIGAILDRSNLISLGALPYGANESMFICANQRRLVENTSWQPRFTLASGLQMTIAWWQTWLEGQA
jgi:nucleoside-diphosphate-sugar epimerase